MRELERKKARNRRVVGIRVDLPFEQQANPFVGQLYEHKTFFTRLHQFVLMSDAYIVAPGGIGTVLEAMTISPGPPFERCSSSVRWSDVARTS
jgi:predicted Rossmann-fold nucleotide-binding protein